MIDWLRRIIYRHRYMRKDTAGAWYWPLIDGNRLYPWGDKYCDLCANDGELIQENLDEDESARLLAAAALHNQRKS